MKITTSELKQIIKEEAERFAKIKSLEVEKNKVEKELKQIYSEGVDENESTEESVEEGIDGMELTEPVSVEESLEESGDLEEGKIIDSIKDWFSKEGSNVEEALKKLQEHIIKMIESHDMPNEAKEKLKKSAEGVAKKLYDKASGEIYNWEPAIHYYKAKTGKDKAHANDPDRPAQWKILAQKATPDSPWLQLLQTLTSGAADDLKGRGLSMYEEGLEEENIQEAVKSEVKKAIKAEKLKERAKEIIEEIKSL